MLINVGVSRIALAKAGKLFVISTKVDELPTALFKAVGLLGNTEGLLRTGSNTSSPAGGLLGNKQSQMGLKSLKASIIRSQGILKI